MENQKFNEKRGKKVYKIIAAVVACIVVIIGIFAFANSSLGAKSESYDSAPVENGYQYSDNEAEDINVSSTSDSFSVKEKNETTRKIIKNANLSIQTKDFNGFVSALNKKIESFNGYTDSYSENNYSTKNAEIVVRIPSENLEKFLTGIDEIGTVQSKQISKSDVTDSYFDIESRIKALDTEEEALLKILEKCKTVSETIEVQSRLSEVRAQAESYKGKKKSYDSQISYSTVTLSISQEERIIKNDGTFSSKLKEKFNNSLYNIGSFFKNLAITVLGDILYILIIGAIAAVIVIIIRKKRRKNH